MYEQSQNNFRVQFTGELTQLREAAFSIPSAQAAALGGASVAGEVRLASLQAEMEEKLYAEVPATYSAGSKRLLSLGGPRYLPDFLLVREVFERCGYVPFEGISFAPEYNQAGRCISVKIRDVPLVDVSWVSELRDIERLQLLNARISDIGALAATRHLTELQLDGNSISDLSPLSRLTSLQRLSFIDNQVADLSPLAGLSDLRSLRISRNPVCDLRPLLELPRLTSVTLADIGCWPTGYVDEFTSDSVDNLGSRIVSAWQRSMDARGAD